MHKLQAIGLSAIVLGSSLALSGSASAATCIGNCGSNSGTLDGDVVPAPGNFGSYDWVSTSGGQFGAARIGDEFSLNATNGSELISDAFFGAAGQKISFNFNYLTSDGSGFADYGFAQLLNVTDNSVTNLFTARTHPTEPVVPGFNMPPVGATLSPGTVLINPGAPDWSPLGGSSGACFAEGCGYTGWIYSEYELSESATYQLRFGAANWGDTQFQSGLAFSGLVVDGSTIGDGSSFASPLLPTEIDPETGAFDFSFIATPAPIVIDPFVAIGYEYVSDVAMLSAEWEFLGDSEYNVSFLDSLSNPLSFAFTPGAGNIFDFSAYNPAGVLGFSVTGIDPDLMLDPLNTTAFKTKLAFAVTGSTQVNMSMIPMTQFVPGSGAIPEPATWAMMLLGFGAIGSMARTRRRLAIRYA